jgi:hypothetical protein
MRPTDLVWWILLGVGAATWIAVLAGVHAGWNPSSLAFAGLATYGLALSLAYHRLGVRGFWAQRKP